MVNYVMKFMLNLVGVLYPVHNLLKKDVEWNWLSARQSEATNHQDTLSTLI